MLRAELISQVQRRIAAYQQQLTDIFRELLKEAGADQGFLAFEDANGNLAIAANKGDYWYLSRESGATGRAVTRGEPSITDPISDHSFKDTGSKVYSELIYPIKFSDQVIGAILLDNFKQVSFDAATHYPILQRYIKKICEVLADEDPWNFRAWWQEQQRLKRTELFDNIYYLVQSILEQRAKDLDAQVIEARVEAILHDGNLVLHKNILGRSLSSRQSDRETVAAALRTGRRVERPAETRKHECLIPFPLDGPVLGIVTLIAQTKDALPIDFVDELERQVRALEYQHYAPALPSGRQGAEHYFHLVLNALSAPTSPMGSRAVLETMARRAKALCGEDLQVVVASDASEDFYTSELIVVTSVDAIKNELDMKVPIERYYCQPGREWLRCPVFVRGQLRGLVKVKNHEISNLYNADIVVVIALLVAELLERLR